MSCKIAKRLLIFHFTKIYETAQHTWALCGLASFMQGQSIIARSILTLINLMRFGVWNVRLMTQVWLDLQG